MRYVLTKKGKETIKDFIAECVALRKEILCARKDTADDTTLPTLEDIVCDIQEWIDPNGYYINAWGVTDNYYDLPISLQMGVDFKEVNIMEQEVKKDIENVLRLMSFGRNYRAWSEDMVDKLYPYIQRIIEDDAEAQEEKDEFTGFLSVDVDMVISAMMMALAEE